LPQLPAWQNSYDSPKSRSQRWDRYSEHVLEISISARDPEKLLISQYATLIKTHFQTGARVSEFVNIKANEFFFDEQMVLGFL
jgi:site-specific recombinase XerD